MQRKCAVSGAFYSDNTDELVNEFAYFDDVADKYFKHLKDLPLPKAMIVPHAGYVYSGFTASCAYRAANLGNYEYALILGPSHRVYVEGVSCCEFDGYETPFGALDFAKKTFDKLKKLGLLTSNISSHQEHSTDVQFPFVYKYLHKLPVLELVYGRVSHEHLCKVVEFALNDPKCLLIVSSDLSHFYTQEEANRRDTACIRAVESLHVEAMEEGGCEACGKA